MIKIIASSELIESCNMNNNKILGKSETWKSQTDMRTQQPNHSNVGNASQYFCFAAPSWYQCNRNQVVRTPQDANVLTCKSLL